MHCFILDDERPFCYLLKDILIADFATQVDFEITPEAAIKYFQSAQANHKFSDLFFCDYVLGAKYNGLDFVSWMHAEQIYIPTVLLTDLDEPSVIARASQLGVQHITKTGIESLNLLRQISLFAFSKWAEQKRAKEVQLRKQSENILMLGAEIAHEFKSVITGAQMQFDRVRTLHDRAKLSDDVLKKIVGQLDVKIKMGLKLSEVLLEYGSMRGFRPKYERASLNSFVREVVEDDEAYSQMRVEFIDFDPVVAVVDKHLLRGLISVLMKNLVDHCSPNVNVRISVGEIQHVGARAAFIEVEDNGKGIPLEARETVFEPGDRCGKEIHYNAGSGLGLGLAFARLLVGMHGTKVPGTIQCLEPVFLAGARFRITLPPVML
jgi:signal transduction histidine kinase